MQVTCKLVVALLLLTAMPALAQEIAWQTNFSQARQLAAEQRRLILLHFYTDNCEPCRVVDKQVFPDRNVVDAIEKNYIPVKLHERDNSELVRRYGVSRFPGDVIVTHTGLPVHRGLSPTTARDYTLLLNNIALQSGIGATRTAQATATTLLPSREQMTQFQYSAGQNANQAAGQAMGNANQLASQSAAAANDVANQTLQTANQTANQAYQSAGQAATQATGQATQAVNQVADQATTQVNGYAAKANSWIGGAAAVANNYATPNAALPAAQNDATQPVTVNNTYMPRDGGYEQPPANPTTYAPPGGAYGTPASMPPPSADSAPAPTMQPWQQALQIPPVGNPPTQAAYTAGNAFAPQPAAGPQGPAMIPVNAAPTQGLEGFCPVTLVEKRLWRKGDVRFGAIHQGRTYLFASDEAQKKFLADPDRFAPILSGVDSVQLASNGRTVDGRREFGVVYRNQVYLFENAASRDAFEKAPDKFVGFAQQAMLRTEQKNTQLR